MFTESEDTLGQRLRAALDFSDVGEWTWDAATDLVELSPVASKIFNLPEGTRVTWTEMQSRCLHPEDAALAAAAVKEAIERGQHYRIEYRSRSGDDWCWVLATGHAHYDQNGMPVGMIGLVQDVSERRREREALAEEAQALDILNRSAQMVASELDLEKVVQAVTDAGVEVTGAQFGAFFYNVTNSAGEAYMLYTLSGVPRERFSHFPMPRNTKVFGPTFDGEGVVRSDDITKDPRYGQNAPNKGMPEGHLPVRSYLAVPVISREGEVIGGLFFGHAEPGVFTARDERVMVGIAAQAAIGIQNARLYQRAQRDLDERRKAEEALRNLTDALEARVRDRTQQFEEANQRLSEEIAERQRAEEQLYHAQKLEAVGQLTGGVAHDFNNLLTVVMGNLEILSRRLAHNDDPRVKTAIDRALEGTRRATSLTQRLLAFARRQPLDPRPADPNKLVQSLTELLYRSLGEGVEIETVLGAGIWHIEVDPGQFENALLNLAVNARDAMPEGGKLTIETQNVSVDERYASRHGLNAGQYVVFSISDTGCGIPSDLLERVIEPFFTTKPTGSGTGLGLSQVYGFVKQSGGTLRIYSELGDGTTVKIFLPRYIGDAPELAMETPALPGDGRETVLVVEDEPLVRELSVAYFQDLNYNVLQAADGYAALRLIEREPNIDLLFTDVGLPKMNGRQLAEEARKRKPRLKVLFTTGYAKNAIVHQGRLDPGVDLIVKPFSFEDLADKVRTILDRS